MTKKVYIAAAFRSLTKRKDHSKAYGELEDSNYISFLEALTTVFEAYGLSTCLPHRDEGQWGKSYYDPQQISELCLRHVATSDIVFAIAENGRGVHIELGFAAAFRDKHIICFYHNDHEPSTLAWGLLGKSFLESSDTEPGGLRVLDTYSDQAELTAKLDSLLSKELGFKRVGEIRGLQRRLSVIDIGSHTLKFKIYSVTSALGAPQEVDQRKESLGIASDVISEGKFKEETITALVDRLTEWIEYAQSHDVDNFRLVGTDALRSAENTDELLNTIRTKTALDIDILTHERELELIHKAVSKEFRQLSNFAVLNLGGGSTQVGVGGANKLATSSLLGIGTRQVMEEFPWEVGFSDKQYKKLLNWVKGKVEPNLGVPAVTPEALIHTGGELDFLLRCKAPLALSTFSTSHVSQISVEDFRLFANEFRKLSLAEVVDFSGLDPKWAAGAIASNSIALAVCDYLGAPVLVPSNRNISDGLLREMLDREYDPDGG